MYDKYDPHDTIAFYYDAGINRFVNEKGDVIHNIYHFVTPSQVYVFKKEKKSSAFPDITDSYLIELIYPDYSYIRRTTEEAGRQFIKGFEDGVLFGSSDWKMPNACLPFLQTLRNS